MDRFQVLCWLNPELNMFAGDNCSYWMLLPIHMPWALGMSVEHICFYIFCGCQYIPEKRPQFVRHCLNGTDLEYVTKAVSDSLSTFHLGLGPPLPPSWPSSSSSSSSGLWQISGTLLKKRSLRTPTIPRSFRSPPLLSSHASTKPLRVTFWSVHEFI